MRKKYLYHYWINTSVSVYADTRQNAFQKVTEEHPNVNIDDITFESFEEVGDNDTENLEE